MKPAQILIEFHEHGNELKIITEHSVPAGASALLRLATQTAVTCLVPLFDTVQQTVTGQLDADSPQVNPNN